MLEARLLQPYKPVTVSGHKTWVNDTNMISTGITVVYVLTIKKVVASKVVSEADGWSHI